MRFGAPSLTGGFLLSPTIAIFFFAPFLSSKRQGREEKKASSRALWFGAHACARCGTGFNKLSVKWMTIVAQIGCYFRCCQCSVVVGVVCDTLFDWIALTACDLVDYEPVQWQCCLTVGLTEISQGRRCLAQFNVILEWCAGRKLFQRWKVKQMNCPVALQWLAWAFLSI